MKIKHSVSSSHLQTMGDFFAKKALYEETNFLRQIYGGKFYIGTNNQIMQGGKKIFTNAFFNNLKIFPSHGGRYTWK